MGGNMVRSDDTAKADVGKQRTPIRDGRYWSHLKKISRSEGLISMQRLKHTGIEQGIDIEGESINGLMLRPTLRYHFFSVFPDFQGVPCP
jgi:hypothetical protein